MAGLIKSSINFLKEKSGSIYDIFLSFVLVVLRSLRMWRLLVKVALETLYKILINPSFLIFCTLALGIGSLGLWIEVFDGLDLMAAIKSSDKNTLLTFSIALLGSVAVEQYFKGYGDANDVDPEAYTRMYLGIFCWCVSLLLSFYSYFAVCFWYLGVGASVSFWVFYSIHNPIFDKVNRDSLNNLRIAGEGGKVTLPDSGIDEIEGKGL